MDNDIDAILKNIEIASPCSMNWDDMEGDTKSRFCQSCKLNVFNLSSMTKSEILEFLRSVETAEDQPCVRLYKRTDGTVLTADCPIGRRIIDAAVLSARKTYLSVIIGIGIIFSVLCGKLALEHATEALSQSLSQAFSKISQQGNMCIHKPD